MSLKVSNRFIVPCFTSLGLNCNTYDYSSLNLLQIFCALVYKHVKLNCLIVLKESDSPSAQFDHFLFDVYYHPDSFLLAWNVKLCFVPVQFGVITDILILV